MNEERKKPGVAFWATVALVVLPVLYVASSGPMTTIAFRRRRVHEKIVSPDGTERDAQGIALKYAEWFPVVYAPILWVSEQEWCGDVVWSYWSLFPMRAVSEGP